MRCRAPCWAAVATLLAGPGQAQSDARARAKAVTDSISRQLRRQGYRDIAVSRTLLGRVQITAERRGALREIVVNPFTGEILRDVQRNGPSRVLDRDGDGRSAETASGGRRASDDAGDDGDNDRDGGDDGGDEGGDDGGDDGGDSDGGDDD